MIGRMLRALAPLLLEHAADHQDTDS